MKLLPIDDIELEIIHDLVDAEISSKLEWMEAMDREQYRETLRALLYGIKTKLNEVSKEGQK